MEDISFTVELEDIAPLIDDMKDKLNGLKTPEELDKFVKNWVKAPEKYLNRDITYYNEIPVNFSGQYADSYFLKVNENSITYQGVTIKFPMLEDKFKAIAESVEKQLGYSFNAEKMAEATEKLEKIAEYIAKAPEGNEALLDLNHPNFVNDLYGNSIHLTTPYGDVELNPLGNSIANDKGVTYFVPEDNEEFWLRAQFVEVFANQVAMKGGR